MQQYEHNCNLIRPAAPGWQVVSALVGEIVLCTKEVNQKTRAAAFALLVDLARAMHAASPLPHPGAPADAAMGASAAVPALSGLGGRCRKFRASSMQSVSLYSLAHAEEARIVLLPC